MNLKLKDLFNGFRNPCTVKALSAAIVDEAKQLEKPLYIMEVCGGHTHVIMKYGLFSLLPDNIRFVHGPGCPVCIMPKERIDQAIALAKMDNTILLTLGDMIRVPGSESSLAYERANGYDVRALYSPLDAIKIAGENPDKKIIFFAIGFETTTPMTAVVIEQTIKQNIRNLYFHINHVIVTPPIRAIMDSESKVNAFIAPGHVSVITGSKIFIPLARRYNTPIVISGFEPIDIMQSILMIIHQKINNQSNAEIQYSRSVTIEGNLKAQELINRYMQLRENFRWRGIGDIPGSALQLRDKYSYLDAEKLFAYIFSHKPVEDNNLCICGEVLKGINEPPDCKLFGNVCVPDTPVGSCMVSSEGTCNAYYRYQGV